MTSTDGSSGLAPTPRGGSRKECARALRKLSLAHLLDPFCGPGTAAVAAKLEGMKCTGSKISQKYCEIARRRIAGIPTPLLASEKIAARAGTKLKEQLEDGKHQTQQITIEAALRAFVQDCTSRNLNVSTLRKYELLRSRLLEFSKRNNLTLLAGLETAQIRAFRDLRALSARTATKELERLRSFFRFCQDNGWIAANPAKGIRPPKVNTLPRIPFNEDEVQNIIAQAKDDKELAFVLCLRHTGLRIGDTTLLKVSQVSGDRVRLYTTKSGSPISIKIPETLSSLLQRLQTSGGYYFLRGESTNVHNLTELWRRSFQKWCKAAGVSPANPHRMRHTLASDLLSKGVPVEAVAAILGNSPAIVIKHYSQWIKSRQDALDVAIESTWEPKLRRIK
jgi:site-specific recombinase XerD